MQIYLVPGSSYYVTDSAGTIQKAAFSSQSDRSVVTPNRYETITNGQQLIYVMNGYTNLDVNLTSYGTAIYPNPPLNAYGSNSPADTINLSDGSSTYAYPARRLWRNSYYSNTDATEPYSMTNVTDVTQTNNSTFLYPIASGSTYAYKTDYNTLRTQISERGDTASGAPVSFSNSLIGQNFNNDTAFGSITNRAFVKNDDGTLRKNHFAYSGRPKYMFAPSSNAWINIRDYYNENTYDHQDAYPNELLSSVVTAEANFMARTYSDIARDSNITIYTIGLVSDVANGADPMVLQRLANSPYVYDANNQPITSGALAGNGTNYNGVAATAGKAFLTSDLSYNQISNIFYTVAGEVKAVVTK
jgi:hypothetical protein